MAPADTSGSVGTRVHYWDGVGGAWIEQHLDQIWRTHSDTVNAALLERWLPVRRLRRILKTDLFDEAVADGLYPVMQRRAPSVAGFDVSPKIVRAACVRHPMIEGVVADCLQLPFGDGEFDAVVSLSTLDHLSSREDIHAGVSQLYRVLAPGGILVITLDNASNPVVALRNCLPYPLLRGFRLIPYRMGPTCTARRFIALLASCRFDVREVTFVVHCPRVIAVLAARLVARLASREVQARFLRILAMCERLEQWPTRTLTGYYVAALAIKR